MFRPGTVNEADYSPQEESSNSPKPHTFGNIQKISQEGGKNTYVIILSKDCIKGDQPKGQPVIKFPPGNHGRAVQRRPPNIDVKDNEFDSPFHESGDNLHKSTVVTEDVKLNLSNINDDEYDSNTSATNVFLKPELIGAPATHDSAIEADFGDSNSLQDCFSINSTSTLNENTTMNTYNYPSPLICQTEKKHSVGQHTFPVTSQFAHSQQSLLQNSNSTARKIFLVTPEQGNEGVLKKSVAYTNEAVPVISKSKSNDRVGSVSLLNKTNPKAVPTFSNISPINQTEKSAHSFLPINPSPSRIFGSGPYTSTPLTFEMNPRLQQLKQESSTHRPVYVIKPPFSRQTSLEHPGYVNKPANESDLSVIETSSVPTLNNSSGFISGSSSLELFEASSSVDSPRNVQNRAYSQMEACDKLTESIGAAAGLGESLQDNRSVTVKTYSLKDGGVVVQVDEDSTDVGISLESETDPLVTSSQESDISDIDKGILNKSLTNMQWLKGAPLKEEKITSAFSAHTKESQFIPWKSLTMDEIKAISDECGRERRPRFSYMSMIQMALYSREDRKMTLKEICQWIEDMFPYYRYTAKPGWKNSIRHNLSLYNIFERSPAKRHGSYWTINPDMEPKMKPYRENKAAASASSEPLPSQRSNKMIPIIPMYSSMGQLSAITPGSLYVQPTTTATSKKKGPPPILPRPSPYTAPQTYALIPINNVSQPYGNPSQPGQPPVIVNLSNSSGQLSACPSPGITEMSAGVASIHVTNASPIPMEYGHSSTALTEHPQAKVPTMNIVKQAWLDCQTVETASSIESDITTSNDMTSSNEMASSSEFTKNRGKSKRPRILNSGLPRPTMYVDKEKEKKLMGSKRRKLQQKERSLMNDSSEEEDEGEKFISNLVKDLPLKSTEAEIGDPHTTSTPFKKVDTSGGLNQLPSPIPGLTPLRNTGIFDGSFLDTLTDKNVLGFSPSPVSLKKTSTNINQSPNASLLDFVTIPTFNSPDKYVDGSPETNNPNLSKFLSECGLDPNFVENTETFPNLNWSSIQQMVDSMDTNE